MKGVKRVRSHFNIDLEKIENIYSKSRDSSQEISIIEKVMRVSKVTIRIKSHLQYQKKYI